MSFQTDIRNVMISASNGALALLQGGADSVKYIHLPEDFDYTKSWLVYDYSVVGNANCINSQPAYTTYQLIVVATTNDSLKTEELSDALVAYLDGLSYSNIADINFESDAKSVALNKAQNIYQNALTFTVTYT